MYENIHLDEAVKTWKAEILMMIQVNAHLMEMVPNLCREEESDVKVNDEKCCDVG